MWLRKLSLKIDLRKLISQCYEQSIYFSKQCLFTIFRENKVADKKIDICVCVLTVYNEYKYVHIRESLTEKRDGRPALIRHVITSKPVFLVLVQGEVINTIHFIYRIIKLMLLMVKVKETAV